MASSGGSTPLRPRSSGFSLVSVLLATGLISILAMTTLHLVKLITSQSRYIANLEDLNNVTKQVASTLAVPSNCVSLYGGTPVSLTNIGTTATQQLNVSAKAPFVGADPMNTISSGRIRLMTMGLILKRSLAGAGQTWYQGDAVIHADDPADVGNFGTRKIPVNFQFDASNNVVSCAAAGISLISTTASSSTGLAYGQCGPGQVMVGIKASGVICTGGSATASGLGCTGDACAAYDGGPCYGDACTTNGLLCQGDACTACGTCPTCGSGTATCTGNACCAGPTCGGC